MMGTRTHPLLNCHAYFVTTTTAERRPIFSNGKVAELFIRELLSLRDELGFLLISYVVMPDHIHLVLVPAPTASLAKIMQYVKGRFARRFNRQNNGEGKVWQSRYYESIMRDERSLLAAVQYIDQNPVVAGLAGDASQYPYSSASQTLDLKGYLSGEAMADWPG